FLQTGFPASGGFSVQLLVLIVVQKQGRHRSDGPSVFIDKYKRRIRLTCEPRFAVVGGQIFAEDSYIDFQGTVARIRNTTLQMQQLSLPDRLKEVHSVQAES